MDTEVFDFIIVGSGLAGSAAAVLLSAWGEVALVDKGSATASNSYAAQGGIAAALAKDDTPELHLRDTLAAGDGMCDPAAVERLVSRAPSLMRWLMDLGVAFDTDLTGQIALGLEGAHAKSRILHAGGDATGANVVKALTQAVDANPRIRRLNGAPVHSLLHANAIVSGVYATLQNGRDTILLARKATVLATGGVGQLFAQTTNPLGATGDGIALAYEAGAVIRNLEFIQFHPTALCGPANPQFLISEAVRGAGAGLVDAGGNPVMIDHPQGDLAPRDVVARRIDQVRQTGVEVFLDARAVSDFAARFPTIFQKCVSVGLDPLETLLPISPAAHFSMGGVAATLAGETNVRGLYVIGEAANTGVHGANRLASNSLLECVAMAHELAQRMQKRPERLPVVSFDADRLLQSGFGADQPALLAEVRRIMWQSAGILRDRHGLVQGLRQLQDLAQSYPRQAALTTATLIVQSALAREESRGAHYRVDFPRHDPKLAKRDTVFTLGEV